MTGEEAREYFEHHMRFYCVTGVCREAEEMAAEEFKKEPCKDAISRQAAIGAINRLSIHNFAYEEVKTGWIVRDDAVDELRQLPPVTPKQRTCDDVLDKIRAEIEERKKNSGGEPNRELAFNVCLRIIDKYRVDEPVDDPVVKPVDESEEQA